LNGSKLYLPPVASGASGGDSTETIHNVEDDIMWSTPVVREIAVGLEINCYACADL